MRGGDLRGGLPHLRQHGRHLLAPAAGQQADHGRVAVDAERLARVGARRRAGEGVEHRVADERHGHTREAIERRLERKHREHERDDAADEPDAPRPPGPDLRRQEVRDGDAGAPRGAGQSKIEFGKIDHDERVGAAGSGRGRAQPAVGTIESGDAGDRLGAAHRRRRRDVDEELHALRGHASAAHAVEPDARRGPAQRARQRGAVQIAGGLAGDQHDRARPLRRRRHAC